MVYIVTYGEYSDRCIDRVFIDREKAYSYAELHDFDVAEYRLSDDDVKIGSKWGFIVKITCYQHAEEQKFSYRYAVGPTFSFDSEKEAFKIRKNKSCIFENDIFKEITIIKLISCEKIF